MTSNQLKALEIQEERRQRARDTVVDAAKIAAGLVPGIGTLAKGIGSFHSAFADKGSGGTRFHRGGNKYGKR